MCVLILLLATSCDNKKIPVPYIKPEPVNVYVDKYVSIDKVLTSKVELAYVSDPDWFLTHTWLELYYESLRVVDQLNLKLQTIEDLPLPKANNNNNNPTEK